LTCGFAAVRIVGLTALRTMTVRMLHRPDADHRAAAPARGLGRVRHYNQRRPHRARNLRPPDSGGIVTDAVTDLAAARIRCRKVLGGLIHEYERAA
jgi:hypothetical protein